MSTASDQIAQIKANATPYCTVTVRQAQGGFIVTGQTQWQDNDTKGIVLSENAEGVASSVADAFQKGLNYASTGSFDAAPAA